MAKDLFHLLFRGYFPKELPPCFNTYSFARHHAGLLSGIPEGWGSKTAWPSECSMPKNGIGRRYVHVLNPLTYLLLAKYVIENIARLKRVWDMSPVSRSVPVMSALPDRRFFVPKSKTVADFQDARLERGVDKLVEMKVDISNFYPSIYTHTIPWAMIGKKKAKLGFRRLLPAGEDKTNYDIGNQIDILVENNQDKQTHGIPVGPDVSFVIAETILSRIDANIIETGCEFTGCRYYDDYYLYFDSKVNAQRTLKVMIDEFKSYGLEVNLSKVEIQSMPVLLMDEFVTRLSPFEFSKTHRVRAVRVYFEVLWALVKERPNAANTIFRYGLKVLAANVRRLAFDRKDISILSLLLFKTAVMAPAVIPDILEVVSSMGASPDDAIISRAAMAILGRHVAMKHHLEVLWTLWMCKKFGVALDAQCVVSILKIDNPLCTLMALDYMHGISAELLADAEVCKIINELEHSMSAASLYNENWILLYEGACKGWLDCENIVADDSFFGKLREKNVSFYNTDSDADYTDLEYISRVAGFPEEMRKEAGKQTDRIMVRVKGEAVRLLLNFDFDDEEDECLFNEEFFEEYVDKKIDDEGMRGNLFKQLLDSIFTRTTLNTAEIEEEFVEILSKFEKY